MERPGIAVICNFGASPIRMPDIRTTGAVRLSTVDGAGRDGALPPASVLVCENYGREDFLGMGKLESVPLET